MGIVEREDGNTQLIRHATNIAMVKLAITIFDDNKDILSRSAVVNLEIGKPIIFDAIRTGINHPITTCHSIGIEIRCRLDAYESLSVHSIIIQTDILRCTTKRLCIQI